MKPNKFDAVIALVGPNKHFGVTIEGVLEWHEDPSEKPTEEEIQAKLTELQAEYDAKKYQRDRAVAYDPIPEQLDQIYHDMDGWKKRIKSVKDKYPKP